jgi:uncharacterized protein (DUF362 family)
MDVILEKCESYTETKAILPQLMQPYASMFTKGEKIWVKPNMLSARPPEEAVTTHPMILREVLRFLLALGTRPVVADSPGVGNLKRVAAGCGIDTVCEELNVPLVEIENYVELDGDVFKQLRIAELLNEVDAVVNLPKLKTHGQMVLTMGVKNTFGCVVGLNKPAYHMRAKDYNLFADLLVDVHQLVHPVLTILDGVEGMEGNGPSNGVKKHFGVIGISENAFALDHAVATRLHIDPNRIYTLKRASIRQLIPEYQIRGSWENTVVMPETVGLTEIIPLPGWAQALTHRFSKVPTFDSTRCVRCKICESHCPAQAIDVERQKIDYEKCIRCYVCHELCPENALKLKRKLLYSGGK